MWDWISKLQELKNNHTPVACATITQSGGSAPREPGSKILVLENGEFFGSIGGGNLEKLVIEEAINCLKENINKSSTYPLGAKTGQCCGGVVEVFIECLNKGPSLFLFGAGHVGQAVCKVFQGTPFQVHLMDERKEWLEKEGIPEDIIKNSSPWPEIVNSTKWCPENSYAVIMTHSHQLDQDILESLLERPMQYLGVIGSDTKWQRFKNRLHEKGYLKKI